MSLDVPQPPCFPRKPSGLWGVVLVGGRSSRMGRDKATLPHPAGGTFLDHAISCLRELGLPVVLAGTRAVPAGWTDDPLVAALPDILVDGIPDHSGPIMGIVAALNHSAAAGAAGILVVPVDMPLLTAHDLREMLVDFRNQTSSDDADGILRLQAIPSLPLIGSCDGVHREPLVAIYPLAMLKPLLQLATSSDRSLNRWLAKQPHRLHCLSPAATANVNTPNQYESELGFPAVPAPKTQANKKS